MYKGVVRNSIISGSIVFLIFAILFFTVDEENRSTDNIGDTRTMILFLNSFLLPGLLYGIGMVLALPSAETWKKVVYILGSTIIHACVVVIGLEGDYLMFSAAALAGPTMVFLTNGLLWPGLNTRRQAMIAFPVSALSILPLYYAITQGSGSIEAPSLLGLTSFLFWPIFMSYVLTKFRWPKHVKERSA